MSVDAVRGEYHRDTALHATGMLRDFNRAGLLTAADTHVASRVGAAVGENDESVLLAVAFAVRAARQGSVCVDLASLPADDGLGWPDADGWGEAVAGSRVAAYGVVHHDLGRLYLDRYWREERQVADDLAARATLPVAVDPVALGAALDEAFPGAAYREQRVAAEVACTHRTSIVTGGPGTGKTTTIARLIATLADIEGSGLRVALAAPTGKAAARISQAVHTEAAKPDFPSAARDLVAGLTATTLHRLLGWRPESRTRFRHDRHNLLPYDVVVVDETVVSRAEVVSLQDRRWGRGLHGCRSPCGRRRHGRGAREVAYLVQRPNRSGLMKMMAIGMGKFTGARQHHAHAKRLGLEHIVRTVGRRVLQSGKMIGGLAIVEDAHHNTARLDAVAADDGMEQREEELLALAKSWMPRLPSSTSSSSTRWGRTSAALAWTRESSIAGPTAKTIPARIAVSRADFVRDLAEQTYGNAMGIGMADVTHDRLVRRIDWEPTRVNALSASRPSRIRLPAHFASDRECLQWVAATAGKVDPADVTFGWIRTRSNSIV